MNSTATINVPIGSGVDLLIGILMIVGFVIGMKRGVIVESVSSFAVLVLLTICVVVSKWAYSKLDPISEIPDLFAVILMTVMFIVGLVFLISKVNFLTSRSLEGTSGGTPYKFIGAFLGMLKFYFIAAVFLVTMFKVDEHAAFLPKDARFSRLSRWSVEFVTTIFPSMKFEKRTPSQFDKPGQNNSSMIDEKTTTCWRY